MTRLYTARFSHQVGATIRVLSDGARKELQAALEQAQHDPLCWPQADRYDLDDTVRVIATASAMVHYAILPEPPHLWVFAVMAL